ncbi:hypothetical protein ACLBOM_30855 [Escherichia coli]
MTDKFTSLRQYTTVVAEHWGHRGNEAVSTAGCHNQPLIFNAAQIKQYRNRSMMLSLGRNSRATIARSRSWTRPTNWQ